MRVRCPNGHSLDVPVGLTPAPLTPSSVSNDPFRGAGIDPNNPYANPFGPTNVRRMELGNLPKSKVLPPAIALIVAAALGLVMSFVGITTALSAVPPQVDPNAPPILQEFVRGTHGPIAAAIQSLFAGLNCLILFGSIQMLRFKMRGLAITASILSMINLGNCCCLLGLPFGIWALVVLFMEDVRSAFAQVSNT